MPPYGSALHSSRVPLPGIEWRAQLYKGKRMNWLKSDEIGPPMDGTKVWTYLGTEENKDVVWYDTDVNEWVSYKLVAKLGFGESSYTVEPATWAYMGTPPNRSISSTPEGLPGPIRRKSTEIIPRRA